MTMRLQPSGRLISAGAVVGSITIRDGKREKLVIYFRRAIVPALIEWPVERRIAVFRCAQGGRVGGDLSSEEGSSDVVDPAKETVTDSDVVERRRQYTGDQLEPGFVTDMAKRSIWQMWGNRGEAVVLGQVAHPLSP